jgi:2-phosphosulfolactate phosphatase
MNRSVWIGTSLPEGEVDAVVVVDVIRSMTTAVTAIARGRRCLLVPSLQAAHATAQCLRDPLLAGELQGRRPLGFELTNSPAEVDERPDIERPLVLLSSSGTKLFDQVQPAGEVYAGCLRNVRALAAHLLRHRRVVLLGAPSRGEFREEDRLCCARIARALVEGGFSVEDDATAELIAEWSEAPTEALLGGRSAQWLFETGQRADLEFICQHVDDLDLVALRFGGDLLATSPVAMVG